MREGRRHSQSLLVLETIIGGSESNAVDTTLALILTASGILFRRVFIAFTSWLRKNVSICMMHDNTVEKGGN